MIVVEDVHEGLAQAMHYWSADGAAPKVMLIPEDDGGAVYDTGTAGEVMIIRCRALAQPKWLLFTKPQTPA